MGTATLSQRGRVFSFRCDPSDIHWTYSLNTNVEATYGGQVVQILSAKIDGLSVTASSGSGRWEYYYSLVKFCRDLLFDQKDTGEPAIFTFPPRGWQLKVYLTNFPFTDNWQNVAYPFTLRFKVQEDVNGVMSSDSITSELNKVREGIGYERNDYNYPPAVDEDVNNKVQEGTSDEVKDILGQGGSK